MKIEANHLLEMRDIINELESNLIYRENVELCIKRLDRLFSHIVFDD